MRIEYLILSAVALDLAVGDPRWLPHPVRGIGWLAPRIETLSRSLLGCPVAAEPELCVPLAPPVCVSNVVRARMAGFLAAAAVYLLVGGVAWGGLRAAAWLDPLAADAWSILLIYWAIAPRDLAGHATAVFRPLAAGDLPTARQNVARIVGRDTDRLDEPEIVRAAVESVAESTVDGVTAPLFFAVVAGPVGAIVYRAINTLDSMFGHKDDRYRDFGCAAARIDDAANYIPARLTAWLLCLAAGLTGQRPLPAVRVLIRDGRRHESPNAGLTEAAMAGALGVQLGGRNYYGGEPFDRPAIGDPRVPLAAAHIRTAGRLMFVTTALFLAVALPLRMAAMHGWSLWRIAR